MGADLRDVKRNWRLSSLICLASIFWVKWKTKRPVGYPATRKLRVSCGASNSVILNPLSELLSFSQCDASGHTFRCNSLFWIFCHHVTLLPQPYNFQVRVASCFRGCFRASTSTHPGKKLTRKPNWSHISDNGSLNIQKLRSRGFEVVRKRNLEIMSLGRLGRVNEARNLFDEMTHRDDVSYNSMVTVYLKNNDLSSAELLFKAMPERNIVVESAMIDGYVKAGRLDDARHVFDGMTEKNEFSWTSLISGYFKSGQVEEGRRLFDQMPVKNVVSWTTIVLGYARNGFLNQARSFFDLMPEKNTIAWTAMIKAYLEHDHFIEAYKLFHEMPQRNLYSWNIMISGCLSSNRVNEAIQLFDSMPQRNAISWTIMVSGLARNKMINSARKYFDQMPNKDIAAWNAMIAAYVDEELMDEAHELFTLMPEKNVVTWNTLIYGYTRNSNDGNALNYFALMLRSGFEPDETTMTSVVTSSNGMLELMQAHAHVTRLGFEQNTSLTNALITTYSKSGDFGSAWLAFEQLKSKDAVSWTAMIIAYSNHGLGYHALQAFACMLRAGTTPDAITFVGLLSACSHIGLVNKGRRLFNSMREAYNLNPKAEHCACLVDILGRAGLLDEAMDIMCKMPPSERDEVVLGALLGACKLHGDAMLANSIGGKLLELQPSSSGGYALLANAYAAEGKWDECAQVRKKMRERSVKRIPGYSQIEVRGKNHVFVVGDRSHPQVDEIYGLLLQNLQPLMREMV
ncbi:pentatricopeptide repeat-containing protein At2g35030, mitochondrial-like [Prosopis cineraria]|uniref:pentatricopeptide repeat-containing protein At2g35030, mitochondrial-like n=1 Tax=Prosopis cineraria TaxID=364024 RepID=UPI00240F97E7|nr:pentatricopeptide repeat-containing protein At2g35030, mitochondrial-like [Prosopis cineraria]